MICNNCGGDMHGDGVTVVLHCEHTDAHMWDVEPDAGPIDCTYDPGRYKDPLKSRRHMAMKDVHTKNYGEKK